MAKKKKRTTPSSKSQKINEDKKSVSKKTGNGDFWRKYGVFTACFLAALIYFPTVFFDLTNLDDIVIRTNHEELADFSKIGDVISGSYLGTGYYRPAVTVSLMIDAQIGGKEPAVYHLSNMIFHIFSVLGIYLMLQQMKAGTGRSLAGAVIYAVHPVFTNAVTWILGRNDLLAGMFTFFSVFLFLKFMHEKKTVFLIFHIFGLIFALWSKEIAVLIPLICLFYYVFVEKRKVLSKESLTIGLLWAVSVFLWFFLRSRGTEGPSSDEFGFDLFIKNLPVIPEMVSKFFIPAGISVLPSYSVFRTVSGIILIAALILSVFFLKKRNKCMLIFSSIWLFAFLLPSMFVRHASADEFFDFLDCRLYVPMAGLVIFTLYLIHDRFFDFSRKRIMSILSGFIIILAILSYIQNAKYSGPYKFWHTAAEENLNKAMVWNVLGENYRLEGDFENALKYFFEAARINPDNPKYLKNLSHAVLKMPSPEKKIPLFEEIAKEHPAAKLAHYYPALIFARQKRYREALPFALRTVQSDSSFKDGWSALTDIYFNLGMKGKALSAAKRIAQRGDSSALEKYWLQTAGSHFNSGDMQSAASSLKKALEINPKNITARNNLAVALLRMKNFTEAEKVLLLSAELAPDNLEVQKNLFRLYLFEMGNISEARRRAEIIRNLGGSLTPAEIDYLNKFPK